MKNTPIRICLLVRVSTEKQEYQRQIRELTEYCKSKGYMVSKTIAAKISGNKKYQERTDLQMLFQSANQKEFNKVLVTEISRIGRNARDIRNTIDYLHERKISVVFKNLGGMESLDDKGEESLLSRLLISIFSEIAQEERKLLSERIKSGLVQAVKNGKKIGRPDGSILTNGEILKKYPRLVADLRKGMSLNAAIAVHKVSKGTVIKVKRLASIS